MSSVRKLERLLSQKFHTPSAHSLWFFTIRTPFSNILAGKFFVENDDKVLEDILPDEEMPLLGGWKRLFKFYRNLHIRQTSDGVWKRHNHHYVFDSSRNTQ